MTAMWLFNLLAVSGALALALFYLPSVWQVVVFACIAGPLLYALGKLGFVLFGSPQASTKKPQG